MAGFWKTWTGEDDELVERMRRMQVQARPQHRRLDLVAVDRIADVEQDKANAIRAAWARAVDRVNARRPDAIAVETEGQA
jgi:hypothetical protein